jgi:hypothetical protein
MAQRVAMARTFSAAASLPPAPAKLLIALLATTATSDNPLSSRNLFLVILITASPEGYPMPVIPAEAGI